MTVRDRTMAVAKRNCIRPLRHEKRHESWSSPRWNVRVQNSQPCGWFKDHGVMGYNNRHKCGTQAKSPLKDLSGHTTSPLLIFCIKKIHRLVPDSNQQPWVQKASDQPTKPPRWSGNHYRSIITDHLHAMLQNHFLVDRTVFQEDNVLVHTSRCVQTWLHGHDEVVDRTWCPSHMNSTSLSACGVS
ncbi:hypothetical protein TNCV_2994031 [Trichonephila clavipes]|nr:hypothetical protein TNCV_2994031 [Trichonephila clavipes]